VLLVKEFGNTQLSWLEFFITGGYYLSAIGSILIILSLFYFIQKYKAKVKEDSYQTDRQ